MRKFIYLISPNQIYDNFYLDLEKVLSANNVKFFQLRLKNTKKTRIIEIAKKIKKITKKYKVKFLINDSFKIAKIVNADGFHLGQKDGSLIQVKKNFKNKILGVTCHNSKILAKKAIKYKANYLAFGSFEKSKLKPKAIRANINILRWAKRNTKKKIVAIGGINNLNYKKFLNLRANYIAITRYI